ncbi:MAG: hypothetical protein IT385_08685 [Deltaproteobacteria bacterium]|nr:hypothetical protein [Deltaproteobacteria bacterium]
MKPWLVAVTLACAPVLASSAAHATPPSAAEPKGDFEARAAAAGKIADALDVLAGEPAPKGLQGDDLVVWTSQSAWLGRTATRIRDIVKSAQSAGGDMVSKMAQMNMQFMALQEATQMESRKFNTLSNSSVRSTTALGKVKAL